MFKRNGGASQGETTIKLRAPWSMRAAPIISAFAALFSLQTALSVYQGEEHRLHFEKMRLTSHTYQEYIKRATSSDRPSVFPCLEVLTGLNDADLTQIMRYAAKPTFAYDETRHKDLKECARILDTPPAGQEPAWSSEIQNTVRRRIYVEILALDSALIPYTHDVGEKGFLCENFGGFFKSGNELLSRFVRRMKDANLITKDNLPNIYEFHADLEGAKAKGEKCPGVRRVESGRNWLLDYCHRIFSWLALRLG